MSNNTASPIDLLEKAYLPFLRETREADNKQALKNRRLHNILQCIIIVCTIGTTATLSIVDAPKLIAIILSAIAAVATGFAQIFKFGDRSKDSYLLSLTIDKESRLASFNTGPYKDLDPDATIKLLVERLEETIGEKTTNYIAFGTFQFDKT